MRATLQGDRRASKLASGKRSGAARHPNQFYDDQDASFAGLLKFLHAVDDGKAP